MRTYEANIKKILEVLLNNLHYLTMDFIAQSVGLSKRSVQNYLASIDSWIFENGLPNTQIIRKQGQGVMLEINAADRLKLEKLLCGKSLGVYSDDNKRRLDIIKKLIILEEDMTIKSLAEQFYVSRPIIVSDLEWVEEWLASYKLELFKTQRRGIFTRGSEVSYRNAIAGFFDSYESVGTYDVIAAKKRDRLQENNFQNLIDIYPRDTVEKAKRIIGLAEKEFDFFLTEDYYTSLLTHIVISISRFINGNTVPPEFFPPDDEFPAFIIKTAEYISKHLEAVFNIRVSEVERAYICIHLVGFNAISAEQSANSEMPKKIKGLALELIKAVDLRLGTHFIHDKLLFFGLCLHLKSKIFRLQKDVYYKKTSRFQLLDNSINIYNAVSKSSNLFREICDVEPDEEEILNITCYFLLSVRRNHCKSKALLICNDGIIARIELMDLIEKSLSSIEVADCCTIYQLKFQTVGDYDFVISTETVERLEKPVIDLSAVDKSNYINSILDFINKMEHSRLG